MAPIDLHPRSARLSSRPPAGSGPGEPGACRFWAAFLRAFFAKNFLRSHAARLLRGVLSFLAAGRLSQGSRPSEAAAERRLRGGHFARWSRSLAASPRQSPAGQLARQLARHQSSTMAPRGARRACWAASSWASARPALRAGGQTNLKSILRPNCSWAPFSAFLLGVCFSL